MTRPDQALEGRSVGAGPDANPARIACSTKSRIDRPCARRLSLTVSIRSANRDPAALCEPNDPVFLDELMSVPT